MEVPTVVSLSSLQQPIAEQNVDIPVPCGRRRRGGGLQGFLPAQNSTAQVSPHSGGLQGFRLGQVFNSISPQRLVPWMRLSTGFFFFAIFTSSSKVRSPSGRSSAGVAAHSSSSTLSSDQMTLAALSDEFWEDEAGGVCMRLPSGWCYRLRSEPAVYWDDPG